MIITQTSRLILQTWQHSDINAAHSIWGDQEVMRFVGPAVPLHQIPEILQKAIEYQEKHGIQIWAVENKKNSQIIGACGFYLFENNPKELEIAFHFCSQSWGKGYATEAVIAALNYINGHGFLKVHAIVDANNTASAKVLQKAGFVCYKEELSQENQQRENWYQYSLY